MVQLAKIIYLSREGDGIPHSQTFLSSLRKKNASFMSVTPQSKSSAQAALIVHQDDLALAFRGID